MLEWLLLGVFSLGSIALLLGWYLVSCWVDNKNLKLKLADSVQKLQQEQAINSSHNISRVIVHKCECSEIFSLPEGDEKDEAIMEFLFKKQRQGKR